MLIPYRLETTVTRYPIANYAIILVTSVLFFVTLSSSVTEADILPYVLRDWDANQLLGSLFLHGDLGHLLGNMLFLWVFGNAVNAAVGNLAYPFLYLCLGICAGVTHLSADAHPAIGASGAINGIVGMALVLFPYHKIRVAYWFRFRMGKFACRSFWMILFWNAFDFLAVALGSEDGVGHWAHIGGLTFGMLLAFIAVKKEWIVPDGPTLPEVFKGGAPDIDTWQMQRATRSLEEVSGDAPGQPTTDESSPDAEAIPEGMAPSPIRIADPATEEESSHTAPIDPDIRMTQCVASGGSLVCYLKNEGTAMKEVQLRVPKGVKTRVNPAAGLLSGQSGSIRFQTVDETTIDSIEFIIGFKDIRGTARSFRYRCVPADNSLLVVSQN